MLKIILPTDFSENAYNAMAYARELFAEREVTFYLLNTYTPAVYQAEYVLHSPGQVGLGDNYQARSMERLEILKERLELQFPNPKHKMYTHSAFNTVVDEVVDCVSRESADLIIMGTQGATGAQEIFLGTHTMHVIKKASCPVLVIPSGFQYERPKEILFPTDFEPELTAEHLKILIDIARMHMASIEVLHVSTGYDLTQSEALNKIALDKAFDGIAHLFHDLPPQEIISGINRFQQKTRVNMLAMVRNKHTFIEKLFIEPVIKKIAFHVTIPFLVIPPIRK